MTLTTATRTTLVELDHRVADGISVSLQWRREENRLSVCAVDGKTGETLEIAVLPGEDAMDVFHHPFAYAGGRPAAAA
jgi:hypothetical protein